MMNRSPHLTLVVALLVGATLLLAGTQSQAQTPRPRYQLRASQAVMGSVDGAPIASGSPYPLDRSYDAFTQQEKAALRAQYVDMPEGDEPPFPKRGMRDLIARLASLVGRTEVTGDLTIVVVVDADGNGQSVSLVKYPNVEFATAAARIVMLAPYKPALCAGVPCAGEFPFRLRLGLSAR